MSQIPSAALPVRKFGFHKSLIVLLIALFCFSSPSWSQNAKRQVEPVVGPATIPLGDKLASFNMPADFVFIKKDDAEYILKAQGSSTDGVLGIILPKEAGPGSDEKSKSTADSGAAETKPKRDFWVICRFEESGYVSDDDADKINADELLNSFKEGTKEQNDVRKEAGLEPIYVGAWAEKPKYEKSKHHVVWAIEVKDQESASAPVAAINYNTRILGRRGVMSMNLVTDPAQLPANKVEVGNLLTATKFIPGQTYEDYKPGQDKAAGYGIAGLVLGGGALAAAAKFGIFGALWKWLLAAFLICKKFIVVIVIAGFAAIRGFFGKKKTANSTGSDPANSEPPAQN